MVESEAYSQLLHEVRECMEFVSEGVCVVCNGGTSSLSKKCNKKCLYICKRMDFDTLIVIFLVCACNKFPTMIQHHVY